MRALVHDRPGSAADLHVSEAEMPTPDPGEVRVRVYAAGLNPVDGKLLGVDNPAWSWPHIPGLDFAGVVDAVGPRGTGLSVGQAVAGHGAINSEGTATESLHLLGFNGQLANIGSKPDLGSLPQFTTAPTVHEIALGAAHTSGDPRALRWLSTGLSELMGLVAVGELDPLVSGKVSLEEVPAALAEVLAGKTHGKVVVEI